MSNLENHEIAATCLDEACKHGVKARVEVSASLGHGFMFLSQADAASKVRQEANRALMRIREDVHGLHCLRMSDGELSFSVSAHDVTFREDPIDGLGNGGSISVSERTVREDGTASFTLKWTEK